jgi:hypothetical protein
MMRGPRAQRLAAFGVPDSRFDFGQEVLLAPRTGENLIVLVYRRDGDARKAVTILASQRTSRSFDRREANVVVTSDELLAPATRSRIAAALRTLRPSR